MNIADILNDIVDKLNDTDSCGLCWKLVLGGRSDYFNNERDHATECDCDDCCVRLGVLKISNTFGYRSSSEFVTKVYNQWDVQIFAGVPSGLDIQFYNEVNPSDSDNSKWTKYIHPIHCCLETLDNDICDVHNCFGCHTTIEIVSWRSEMKMNYTDRNLDGWLINATIREYG